MCRLLDLQLPCQYDWTNELSTFIERNFIHSKYIIDRMSMNMMTTNKNEPVANRLVNHAKIDFNVG
jgi:hypothetical protein